MQKSSAKAVLQNRNFIIKLSLNLRFSEVIIKIEKNSHPKHLGQTHTTSKSSE